MQSGSKHGRLLHEGLVGISPSYDEGSMIKRQQMRRGNSGNERGGWAGSKRVNRPRERGEREPKGPFIKNVRKIFGILDPPWSTFWLDLE